MTMTMGRKKDTLKQRSARMTKRRRYRFDEETPFIEMFKPEFQRLLIMGDISEELKSLLKNGDKADIRKLTYLDFRQAADPQDEIPSCTRAKIYQWLAKLLLVIGDEGTMYGKSMIFRYLANGHSSIFENEFSLKTSVNTAIRRICLTNILECAND